LGCTLSGTLASCAWGLRRLEGDSLLRRLFPAASGLCCAPSFPRSLAAPFATSFPGALPRAAAALGLTAPRCFWSFCSFHAVSRFARSSAASGTAGATEAFSDASAVDLSTKSTLRAIGYAGSSAKDMVLELSESPPAGVPRSEMCTDCAADEAITFCAGLYARSFGDTNHAPCCTASPARTLPPPNDGNVGEAPPSSSASVRDRTFISFS
jgi:hypothetical protein